MSDRPLPSDFERLAAACAGALRDPPRLALRQSSVRDPTTGGGAVDRLLHRRPGSDVDVAVLVDDKAVRHGEAVRHDLADRGLGTPEANRDSFTLLERAEEIDHSISYRAQTTELGDLEAFARWAAGKLD